MIEMIETQMIEIKWEGERDTYIQWILNIGMLFIIIFILQNSLRLREIMYSRSYSDEILSNLHIILINYIFLEQV